MNSGVPADGTNRRTFEEGVASALAFFRGHAGFIGVTVGAILMAAPTAWEMIAPTLVTVGDESPAAPPVIVWLFWAGALLGLAGIVAQVRLRPSYSELEKREAAAQLQATASAAALQDALLSLLRRIADHCSVSESHQRLSIYCVVGDKLVMLARHSSNPQHCRPGRGIYSLEQGVIGDAWQKGESYASNWPEDEGDWLELQERVYGMDRAVALRLTMRTRSIGATRLSYEQNPIGVLVMESTAARGVGKRNVTALQNSLLRESVEEIMASARPHFPQVAEYVRAHRDIVVRPATPTPL